MANISKKEKEYVKAKIEKCELLMKNADSEAQRAEYNKYRVFWIERLPKKAQAEIIEAEKEELKTPGDEPSGFDLELDL